MSVCRFTVRIWCPLILFCLVATGCSTRVRLGVSGSSLFARPVDLAEVESSWTKIRQGKCDREVAETYNRNVREAAAQLIQSVPEDGALETIFIRGRDEVPIRFDAGNVLGYRHVDRMVLSDAITIRKGISDTARVEGIGVPMLARIQRSREDALIPETGLWIPVTGYLEAGNRKTPVFRLVETTRGGASSIHGCCLAANFSAPLARDLFERQREFQKLRALVNYERFAPYMGIERVFAFDRNKIPVVLIHGVFSSSSTWAHTLNTLMEDPCIRDRFEFWVFSYPTGAPIPFLAGKLREYVDQMYAFRRSRGAGNQGMILVGHSMGGLMARTLSQRSGDEVWNALFRVPPKSLNLSREKRRTLEEMFFFDPVPYVDRVIFIATPHRGTTTADRPPARALANIMKGPSALDEAVGEALLCGPDAFTPVGWEIMCDFPSSVEQMRSVSTLGRVFAALPLNSGVGYHSIIGGEDRVVEFESAEIGGVISERVVESNHSVHMSEEGIEELSRILKSIR